MSLRVNVILTGWTAKFARLLWKERPPAEPIEKNPCRVADLTGQAVCDRVNMTRSRLGNIENGYVNATPEELERISAAIDRIISKR